MAITNLYALTEARPDHPNFGEPFYVGIGTPKRPRRHLRDARSTAGHRNWRLQEVLAAHLVLKIEPGVSILGTFETKALAGEAERALIAHLGRLGIDPHGCLTNLAAGGEGPDADLMRMPKIRARNSAAQKLRSPESRAASDAALVRNLSDPEVQERRRENSREPQRQSWLDLAIRERRTEAMVGKPKTMSGAAIEARRTNARAPKKTETLEGWSNASKLRWADPAFREQRSRNQAAAWDDPKKRANMLAGRSQGIAASWDNADVRERRQAAISGAVATKWADDPEYAERTRAGLRAAWQDPEKRKARIARMLDSRRRKAAERAAAASCDIVAVEHGEHDSSDQPVEVAPVKTICG